MRSIILLTCSAVLCTALNTSAQQVINGGFEPSGNISPCTDISLADYNTNMGGGNRALGGSSTIRVEDASCSNGNPLEGAHFIALEYSPPFGNIVLLKLDKAMTANTEYSLRVNYKSPVGAPPATVSLKYGYSMSSTSADSFVAGVMTSASETWVDDTLKFTPKRASQYVWLELSTLGGDDYTLHIDDVEMLNIPQSVGEVELSKMISLAPNPAQGYAMLTLDNDIALPCSLQLYDVSGRVMRSVSREISAKQTKIDLSGVPPGHYFIKLTDKNNITHTTKLLVK